MHQLARKKFMLLGMAGWLGVLILFLPFAPTLLAAPSQATIHPDPLSIGIKNGETRAVSMRVENVANLYGVEFHLSFDPKIVQVQDADSSKQGVQIAPGDWLGGGFVGANKVDNTRGTIDYAVTLLNPAPPLKGDGIVATIQFKSIGNGTSPLKFTQAILATRDAQEIQSEAQDGAIGVSALGQAPVMQKANQSSNKSPGVSNPTSTAALPSNLLLVGAAAFGGFAFVGALGILLGILIWRGRSKSRSL